MAIHSARGATKRAARKVAKSTTLPAPTQGIDGRIGLGQYSPEHCLYTYNILSGQYGMKIRKGYREYVLNVDDTIGTGVRTIIPFTGIAATPADDKLFAVTNEGIWDVTTDADVAPVKVLAFATTTAGAGYGIAINYITDADAAVIFYADELNGLFMYTASTDTWAAAAGITGVAAADIRFIMSHKERLWMIEQDSNLGWYLPLGAISGAATKFQFGNQFKHGGLLAGLYNWTVDGGDGVDDYLVGISDAGDVLPYRGSDPTGVDWELKGKYFIGAVAGGSRCASETGGDLHMLSVYGLTSMTDLLQGVYASDFRSNTVGSKMAYALRADMAVHRSDEGWAVNFMPSEGMLLLNTPQRNDSTYIQYSYDIATNSFGFWRDVPMLSFASWRDAIYIGTEDNRVLVMDTDLDDVKITPPASGLNGSVIQFSFLLTFSDLGEPSMYKRPDMARADFISHYGVTYATRFNFDYALNDDPRTFVGVAPSGDTFDSGKWDAAIWSTVVPFNTHTIEGSAGYGRTVAVAIKGAGRSTTWFMSVDVLWTPAGVL